VSWPVMGTAVALYLLVVWLLYREGRGRSPLVMRVPMMVYNVVQVGLCAWMTVGFASSSFKVRNLLVFCSSLLFTVLSSGATHLH
jgi:hypothetical protein